MFHYSSGKMNGLIEAHDPWSSLFSWLNYESPQASRKGAAAILGAILEFTFTSYFFHPKMISMDSWTPKT